jgi:SAM-dependent methyltransferase
MSATAVQSDSPSPDRTGYGRLVEDGHYAEAPFGLHGKHDNVRRLWEDQATRFAVRPALLPLLRHAQAVGGGLRIIDLGCGAGEGWDLLRRVPVGSIAPQRRYLLDSADIACYHGVDLCPEMVEQCARRFADRPQASFAQGDLNEPDRMLRHLPAFDLYYNSYASLSHLDDDGLCRLVRAVLAHQPGPCALVVDVHGQLSTEWPCYWGYSRDPAVPRMQPYNMVWMYPAAERERRLEEQQGYRIRYWRGDELREFLLGIPGLGGRLRDLALVDRSVLVGRQVDTACFNPEARPLRRAVNRMFAFNHAAEPGSLRAVAPPRSGDPAVDGFFAEHVAAWNALVDWYGATLAGEGGPAAAELCAPGGPVPAVLRPGLEAIAHQARDLAWFDPGDPEANLLQPQFGLLLRQLEVHGQRGLGCGHGLVAVVQLNAAGGR